MDSDDQTRGVRHPVLAVRLTKCCRSDRWCGDAPVMRDVHCRCAVENRRAMHRAAPRIVEHCSGSTIFRVTVYGVEVTRAALFVLAVAFVAGCGGSDAPHHAPATATPTATADVRIFETCPGFTPYKTVINGTPYVVLAAACTPTATGGTPPLPPVPTATRIPLCYDIGGDVPPRCATPTPAR